MDDDILASDKGKLAKKITDELIHVCNCKQKRAVHTLGIGATGVFEASPVAREYCIAKHFQGGTVPVTVRFSNGAGNPERHDGWSDVRGLAVRFHLDGDRDGQEATDLIAMTLPLFFTRTGEEFYEFILAGRPAPCFRQSPWRKILDYLAMKIPMPDPYPGQEKRPDEGAIQYADGVKSKLVDTPSGEVNLQVSDTSAKSAQLGVLLASAIGAPESYVMATYAAVHTFIVTAPAPDSNQASDGVRRWVRFAWEPVDGVLKKRPRDWPHHDPAAPPEDDYLDQALRDRIERGPARFELIMTIGEIGDDFNDPTRPWPPHRVRVIMGKLILDKVPDEQEQDERIEKMNFNPLHLTEGIAPSDDPVLALRGISYWYSSNQRGGLTCPFSRM